MRVEVLTSVNVNITDYWNVTPCISVSSFPEENSVRMRKVEYEGVSKFLRNVDCYLLQSMASHSVRPWCDKTIAYI
jgi:hypothetical protein